MALKIKKPIRVIYLDQLLLPLICISFILLLISFSKTAIYSASKGLNLWINVVFPSLFPFFVASYILNNTGFIRAAGVLFEPIMWPLFRIPGCGSFALAMGITSGYPMGAVLTTGLYEQGLLTKNEAERLLAFTNNSGPLFIIGAVGTGMLGNPRLGLYLLICHIAAAFTVGIILRFAGNGNRFNGKKADYNLIKKIKKELFSQKGSYNTGVLIGDAVKNAVMTLLTIGGFIILFSVIINLLLEIGFIERISVIISALLEPFKIDYRTVSSIISGFFEITTGTNTASLTITGNLPRLLSVLSFIIGWAGLSVHFQVISIISKTNISIKPYFFGKLLQGIIAAAYSQIGIKVFKINIEQLKTLQLKEVFLPEYYTPTTNWYSHLIVSCIYLLITLAVWGFMILFLYLLKPFFNQKIKPLINQKKMKNKSKTKVI